MVEHGLQVRFNEQGCFVKDIKHGCRLIAKGKKEGMLLKLEVGLPELSLVMFLKSHGVV